MGMFNNLKTKRPHRILQQHMLKQYYLNYIRKSTDSGLTRWIDNDSLQKGFQLNDGNVTVLNDCILIVILDGIKHKKKLVTMAMKLNNQTIKSYEDNSNNKLNLLRLTYAGRFQKNDVISVEFENMTDIQLTIYGASDTIDIK